MSEPTPAATPVTTEEVQAAYIRQHDTSMSMVKQMTADARARFDTGVNDVLSRWNKLVEWQSQELTIFRIFEHHIIHGTLTEEITGQFVKDLAEFRAALAKQLTPAAAATQQSELTQQK